MGSAGVIIIKVVALVVLFIATVVGCHAHFNSVLMKDLWDEPGFADACKAESSCPSSAVPMERTFVALTIICFILSALSILAGFFMDSAKMKGPDAGYHGFAGVLIIIAGILLIVAAIRIDDFIMDSFGLNVSNNNIASSSSSSSIASKFVTKITPPITGKDLLDDLKTELRKEFKFYNKLAGGALAIIDGLLYFVAAGIISKS